MHSELYNHFAASQHHHEHHYRVARSATANNESGAHWLSAKTFHPVSPSTYSHQKSGKNVRKELVGRFPTQKYGSMYM